MSLPRLLSLTTALLLTGVSYAAAPVAEDAQEQTQQSACAQATDGTSAEAMARSSDADIDGHGACRLSDGSIGKGRFRTAGVSAANDWNSRLDDPAGRRLAAGIDDHGLAQRTRVITLDAATGTQENGLDGWTAASATDLFAAQDTWYRTGDTLPAAVDGSTAADAGFVYSTGTVAVSSMGLPAALTSRDGGALDDAAVIPSPVPEPGTWAMLLAGLAMLAALARRQR